MLLCMALTNRCSFQCLTCLNSSNPQGEYGLSTETLMKTMDWLAKQDDPQVDFTGGEPFNRHDICQLIQYGSDRNITMNICTNGWDIEDKDIPLLKKMRRVALTFYGLENFHDSITRVEGSHKRAFRILSLLKDSQVRLRANIVTLAGALYDLPGLAYELQKAGASEIKFSMMLPHGPARESMSNLLTIRENNILKQSLLARDDLYIPIQFQCFDRYSFMCHIPEKKRLFFAADGRIYPCSAFLNSDHEIGRVTGKQSVSKSFERIAWCKVLNLVKQIEKNKCPALELGLYVDCQDMIVHQGCPPFAERLVEKR